MATKNKRQSKKNKEEEFVEEYDFPKTKTGMRHLIECNCILPQYSKLRNPIFHKFPVFSVIDEDNKVIEKIVECNNCGIVHKITEIGVSEITRKENMKTARTINDIKYGLPENFAGLLEQHNCDISVWEEVEFNIEEEIWNSFVVLQQEEVDEHIHGKMMIVKGPSLVKIESFSRSNYIG
jgi:hypothetical protein